jgi:two-component system sensor histidine kinase YesM
LGKSEDRYYQVDIIVNIKYYNIMLTKNFAHIFNRISKRADRLLRRINVSDRLKVGFILLSVLPVLAVGYFSYWQGSRAIYNKMSRSTTQTVDQIGVNLSYHLQAIINDATEISYSDLVQDALINFDSLSNQELNYIESELSEYINKKYIFTNRVSEITLYTSKLQRINAYGPSPFRFMPKKENLEALTERAGELDGGCLWMSVGPDFEQRLASKISGDRKSIVLTRAVKSLQNGEQIGYILLRVDEPEISCLYDSVDIGEGSQMFIINSDNTVISSAGDYAEVSLPYRDPGLLKHITEDAGDGSFIYKYKNDSYLAVFSSIKQADWHIVALVRFSYLYSDSRNLLWSILLIGIFCVLFALCVNLFISKSIETPIKQLIDGINSFKSGEFGVSVDDTGNDEFTELNQCFNDMTIEIEQLIQDIKKQEKQKRELEIRALQAQINPHFIANTLNTVSYIASLKKEKNIVDLVNSILSLLNGCMKNDDSLISVEDEISFLKSYITTQEYRLFGNFSVKFEIDEDVMCCRIPRFLLQPVLENAIIHGIEPSGENGMIVVKGHIGDGRLTFSITDNGVGIDQDQIDSLLKSKNNDRGKLSGIGIANVSERIALLYGPEYGLQINSIVGVYTTVSICLPVIRDNEATK